MTNDLPARNRAKAPKLNAITTQFVNSQGIPMFVIDAGTVHAQYKHKDYVVSIGWNLDPTTGSADAAMTIWSARPSDDAGCWVLMRRCMHEFSDEHNNPLPYAFEQAIEALPILGRTILTTEVHALVDTIMTYVDDVVMLPAPTLAVRLLLQGDPLFDVTLHATGDRNKVLRETTI